MVNASPTFLSPKQAAAYLNCCKNFLDKDRLTHLHGIPYFRLGRKILYKAEDLDAFMEGLRVQKGGAE